MKLLRPLAWRPALVLLVGLAAGMALGASPLWPVAGAAVALLCEGWRAKGVGIAAVLLGIALRPTEPPRVVELQKGSYVVRVASLPRAVGDGASFLAEAEGKRLAAFAPGRGLAMGDVIRAEGALVPLQRGSDDYLISRRVGDGYGSGARNGYRGDRGGRVGSRQSQTACRRGWSGGWGPRAVGLSARSALTSTACSTTRRRGCFAGRGRTTSSRRRDFTRR